MIPKIIGINKYAGRVLHSHSYRKPEEFIGQTVTVLGSAVSGQDIAFELSKHAKIIYLSSRHDKYLYFSKLLVIFLENKN